MKKLDFVLKEYVNKLSVENLKYLSTRLEYRMGADLGEAVTFLSTDLDKWLGTADSCDAFYDMLDTVQEYVDRELIKRVPELVEA